MNGNESASGQDHDSTWDFVIDNNPSPESCAWRNSDSFENFFTEPPVETSPSNPDQHFRAETASSSLLLAYRTDNVKIRELEDTLLRSVALPNIDASAAFFEDQKERFQASEDKSQQISMQTGWTEFDSSLQAELLQLYFRTVHILCPVVNEFEFYHRNYTLAKGRQRTPLQELLLHAMLFASFAHVNQLQLSKSPYKSVIEGQKALFNHVSRSYTTESERQPGNIVLIQTALILSHWSPYDTSKDVNNFWADQAIQHAASGKNFNTGRPHDRVVWWCCLTRNRMLALALRRPHKLKQHEPCDLPVITDFGSSVPGPEFRLLRESKMYAGEIFIALCKLSLIMNKIVLLRHSVSRWDDWRTMGAQSSGLRLDDLIAIDRELQDWHSAFEHATSQFDGSKLPRRLRVSVHVLSIISQ
ncbi:uncharacterized protein A1O5_04332 [Cladophialophora psammophila CBS 110553]|uniref:Xylanolytic transcriptional activator regulatory domain-containing protein n=1 Tax=Cladophialophora psammophila CBS 110553 TaxID=1182543 RepID=W9X4I8_9EURO|nr:uncharacterized protein A1O5_04332 [Cladophialophora psammophila CBS 110553]EXJ71831.1 hypothetical protein A1O5_04332 [Cladophialophora psammophila CBS 110553]